MTLKLSDISEEREQISDLTTLTPHPISFQESDSSKNKYNFCRIHVWFELLSLKVKAVSVTVEPKEHRQVSM